jgi:hypothetical protein
VSVVGIAATGPVCLTAVALVIRAIRDRVVRDVTKEG